MESTSDDAANANDADCADMATMSQRESTTAKLLQKTGVQAG